MNTKAICKFLVIPTLILTAALAVPSVAEQAASQTNPAPTFATLEATQNAANAQKGPRTVPGRSIPVPDTVSPEVQALIAAPYRVPALTGHRRVTAGDTVLTQGSGGVAVFAVQFARVLGARVIATTSTAEKAERLKALGASEVVNYRETPDWDANVRELTDGRGVDCVVEIGGPGTIAMSLKALAVGGHVSLIGASLSSSGTGLDPLLLTGRGITLRSISVGSRADFEAMNRAIALHRLRPVIDRTFPFAEAKAAYRHFEGRGHFGKVVITHD